MLKQQRWIKFAPDLLTEWRQMTEEGRDVACFRKICEDIVKLSETQDCEAAALAVLKQMEQTGMREDYPYTEPSDYEEIRACTEGVQGINWRDRLTQEELEDKIAGAWIGRISGCLLGKPMECFKSREIRTILEDTDNYPMRRYVDSREFSAGLAEKVKMDSAVFRQRCWVDGIGGKAPVDDDTNYTVLAMRLIDEYGRDFAPDDVLEAWLGWLPMLSVGTAERVTYRNAAQGMCAPQTAAYANPYREWIGAQIRGDFFGYINPGDPDKAAWLAWKDACISHVKNGIYGEMLIAAMTAQAAVSDDILQIIEAGLKEIPASSRLAEGIREVLSWYRKKVTQEEVFARIHERYDEYSPHDWCHTVSNAMIVAACLLYGEKDFAKTIGLAVSTGFDTDCNGATAGSVLGMLLGEKKIPAYWQESFGRTLKTSIDGYYEVGVEQLKNKTMELLLRS